MKQNALLRFTKRCQIVALFIALAGHLSADTSVRSIREWVKGDGQTDDTAGVTRAFAACRGNAFTLRVDCPVFIHVGTDISKPIFVDSKTHVLFTNAGLFITDNVMIPTFVITDSSDISFTDMKLEYRGGLPVNRDVGGYYSGGVFVPRPNGYAQPSFAFSDQTLTSWLKANRNIAFGKTKGAARSTPWAGPTNLSSIFIFVGDVHDVTFTGTRMFVSPSTGGDKFIPMAFSFTIGYDANQEPVLLDEKAGWAVVPNVSVPHKICFTDTVLDGYYMGFQGVLQNATFSEIVGKRCGDLQDAAGNNVGGIGKWFAPPHLFYINYYKNLWDDRRLASKNLSILNVKDIGPRVGTARDVSATMQRSGYANSLKIGAIDSSVSNYTSTRPDGLADILSCDNLTLANISGTYDSSFIHDIYPGVRFPADGGYKHLTLNNVVLTDEAENPYKTSTNGLPFGGNSRLGNEAIKFNQVAVNLNRWSCPWNLQPNFTGLDVQVSILFNIKNP